MFWGVSPTRECPARADGPVLLWFLTDASVKDYRDKLRASAFLARYGMGEVFDGPLIGG